MSQSGRSLNGGSVGLFLQLAFIDRLYNTSQTFQVDDQGNVECNTLSAQGAVTASNFIQPTTGGDVDLEEQIIDLQNRVTVIEGEIITIDNEISTIDGEISTINGEISTINTEISTLSTRPYINAYSFVTYTTSYTIVNIYNLTLTFVSVGVINVNVTSKPPTYIGVLTVTPDSAVPVYSTCQKQVSGNDFQLLFFDTNGIPVDVGFQVFVS